MEVYAGMGERREIVLPDSTHVWLNAGTKLIYPKQFNRSMRQVYLSARCSPTSAATRTVRSSSPPTGWR